MKVAAETAARSPHRRPCPCQGARRCQVEILMPTKKPCGEELTLEQQGADQALHQRRLRIVVNNSIKRCCIVKDRLRLWKAGVRDLVMELCGALHNFRVRLTPWQPMVESG